MVDIFNINNAWDDVLKEEFSSDYCQKIAAALDDEYRRYKIYPPKDMIFAALKTVNYPDVKVCILGQDPYHGAGQANGMAFAVCAGVPFPPSLANIFKELKSDLSAPVPQSGTLTGWAKQGVLLLNATLTVREAQPQSHSALGWNRLTDAVICSLSRRKEPLVFILWGASAIAKTPLIAARHKIISSPHPSPLSASRGFFGSKPFSQANAFLTAQGISPVDWLSINDENGQGVCRVEKINTESIDTKNKNNPDSKVNTVPSPLAKDRRRASYYNRTGTVTII